MNAPPSAWEGAVCECTSTTELQPVEFNLSDFVLRLDSKGKVVAVTR